MALRDICLLRYTQKTVVCFQKNADFPSFFLNQLNCLLDISATKYSSEAILYTKRMGEYLLSPNRRTVAVAFLRAE